MTGPSVDIELSDMASGMNVSLRDLMTGVLNGRYDRVTEDDLVHGDKGDPLFFRLDPDRAYSLFGEDLREVEQDMSTVENMSTSGGEEADPTVRSNEGSRPPTATSASAASKKANAPVARSRVNGREPSKGKSTVQEVGETVLAVGGIYAAGAVLLSLFSGGRAGNATLSGQQRRTLLDEGYRGYYEGVQYNPYDPNTEAGRLYQRGWRQAQEEMGTPALN
jgi:hypothetical protein